MLGLFVWNFFGPGDVPASLSVSAYAAIAAAVTTVYTVVTYFLVPRQHLTYSAIIGYWLALIVISLLVVDTGGVGSPFVALFITAALFSSIFGVFGYVPIVGGVAIYVSTLLLDSAISYTGLTLAALFGLLPLALSIVVWRRGETQTVGFATEDQSFDKLNDKLASVSGQSEVVIAAIADGVVSVDEEGVIQLINPAAQKMIGWTKRDALGLDYRSVLKIFDSHDTPVDEANDPIHHAILAREQKSCDRFYLKTLDSKKSFATAITATPVADGDKAGVIIVFRDITRERAEEREQAEFISTASHEMRTPVASIEGYLGLALNPATATVDEKAREYILKAQDAAAHLGRLFQDLLDVSRADDNRLANNPVAIDLVPFVYDIIRGQMPKATAKQLEVKYPPRPLDDTQAPELSKTVSPVYYVTVDRDHLREIIGNLFENAIKYTMAGSITVDIVGDDESIIISIKDTGIGIPSEDLPHLFQKFYRVDNSATREIGGTGLGLYLCRRLAETIGGTLWAESVYEEGSMFFLKLPRTDHEEAKTQLIAHPPAPAQVVQLPQSMPPLPTTSIANIKPQGITANPQTPPAGDDRPAISSMAPRPPAPPSLPPR